MSAAGADPLRVLRERIFELVTWFGDDNERLHEAQGVWRAGLAPGASKNELWDARVNRQVDRLQEQLDSGQRLELASLDSKPADLLTELESIDLVAWLAAGQARHAPAQIVGTGEGERHLIRLARERRPRTARQSGVLYTHLRYHALVPTRLRYGGALSVRVRVKPMQVGLARCEAAVRRGSVNVAVTSFDDGAELEWGEDGAAASVPTAQTRTDKLSEAIAAAGEREIDILVAPELTVPPAERARLIAELRWAESPVALLVPGTFHERVPGRSSNTFNRAILVDGKGNELCEHLKLVQFGLMDGWLESIHLGDEITVLVTPIGTVAVAICKDFCDDHVGQIWQQLQCEWLLVPAYGTGADAHERAAKQIARMTGTITVLSHEGNQRLKAPQNSFVHHTELTRGNVAAPEFFVHNIPFHK